MKLDDAELIIEMPDGSKWSVKVSHIIESRAERYADQYDGDVDKARHDTIELFECDDYEIEDWASNNMNWDEIKEFAVKVSEPAPVDYEDGWRNGEKEVIHNC